MRILPASLQREQRARNQREAHRDYSVHSCAYRALHESAEDVTEYPAKKIKDGLFRHHQPLQSVL